MDPTLAIPIDKLLDVAAGLSVIALTWVAAVNRRQQRLTDRQSSHEELCGQRQGVIKNDLDSIKKMLDEQNSKTQLHRDNLAHQLGEIRTDVAVVKQRVNVLEARR